MVATPTVIGPTTAFAPEIAASSALFPLSRSAAMLSPTTTASSTTMPMRRKKAKSVPMFRVRSAVPKRSSDPTKDSGIPRVTQNAMRRSNTRTRVMKTSTVPISAFRRIFENRSKTGSARSFQTLTVTSWGVSQVASQCLISSAMSTTDCPSAAETRTNTAGLPLNSETISSSTNPSRISATSPTVTIVPSSRVMRGMFLNSSPARRLETVCRTTPPASVRSSPNVRFNEARWMALATWLMDRSLRRSSSSLSSIAISRSRVPSSLTWEMDGNPNNPSRSPSAASRSSFSATCDDETARVMTSIAARRTFTSGRSALRGGKFSILSTAPRTSSSTSETSAKSATSTSIRPRFWLAVLTTRSTPGNPTTASSTRRLMSSSTSRGDEPGKGTVTVTVRVSRSGKL